MKLFLVPWIGGVAAVGALLVGCGPSLHAELKTARAFKVSADCAQGPFVIHTQALGSPWGEDMTLETRGGGISGHATVTVDGHPEEDATFSGGDNHACVLSDAERGGATTAATATSEGAPATPAPPAGTPAPGQPPPTAATTPALKDLPMNLVQDLPQAMVVAQIHREVNKIGDKGVVLPKGADIKIELWSEQPNDFSRTYLVLTQSAMVPPDGNDAKWQAHLDELQADDERKAREAAAEAKKEQAEADAKQRERDRCWNLPTADAKCRDEGYKTYAEQAAEDAENRRCNDLALRNAADAKCRANGWHNANERPGYGSPPAPPPPPTVAVTAPAGPQKHAPDRPPPPPQAEAETPKPSEHAEWVPGSWQWSGFAWVWLSGGWRVPDVDRQQKLTAKAPSAPPPPQVEVRSAQPVASAVWVDGYWHWQGGRWVWVAGRWAVPPSAGATWRPSVWVPDGVQVRLDPGGWVLH